MSFDDGTNSELRLSCDDFGAKFCAALRVEGFSWIEMCRKAGVSSSRAEQIILEGTYGLPQNLPELERLARVLGRDLDWVLHGTGPGTSTFRVSLKERVIKLVWEYIFKAQIPKSDRQPLLDMVSGLVDDLPANSFQTAARPGVPATWKDVARYHERLKHG